MAIKIPFVSDITEFLRGTKNLEDSLDDVADALDDITTAGARVDAQVGEDLESVGREADAAADKVERSFKEAFKQVEAQGRTSTRKVRTDIDHVGGNDPLGDFRDEAKQNLAESVSSFQGDAESAVDAVQSTFGGLITAFGPLGVAAATAVGVGIGALRGIFAQAEERTAAFEARVQKLFEELAENQQKVTVEFREEGIKELISDSDRLKQIFGEEDAARVNANLAKIGLSRDQVSDIFAGLVGGFDEVTDALETVEAEQKRWHDVLTDPNASATAQTNARQNLASLAQIETALHENGKAAGGARAQADLYAAAVNKIPTDKTTKVTVTDNGTAKLTQDEINNIKSSGVPVPVSPDMRGFNESIYKYLNGKTYYVQVKARTGKNALM